MRAMRPGGTIPPMTAKRANLALLTLAQLLAMGLWFSGSAVVPQLASEWGLSPVGRSWITLAVQLGFVAGALGSALLNLPDRVPLPRLMAASALAGALCTAAIPLARGPEAALPLRFLTGTALACVYPPGMKVVASWTRKDRGLGLGLLVGAITVGSALPHLINAVPLFGPGGMPPWRPTLLFAAALAAVGALLLDRGVRPGPHLAQAAPFDWRFLGRSLADPAVRLANFGYLGHMWELYAMWTWAPLFLLAAYESAGWSPAAARAAGFAAVAAGGLGSVAAGLLADRFGRTVVTASSLLASGACCLAAGLLFSSPLALTALCVVWGFAVVADSAQFSSAVSELSDPRYVGTALTLQTSLGFLLTLLTIWLVPALLERLGWRWVFLLLAPGPAFGIVSAWRLRRRPEAARMAGGRR